jgi:hypothetical protein
VGGGGGRGGGGGGGGGGFESLFTVYLMGGNETSSVIFIKCKQCSVRIVNVHKI